MAKFALSHEHTPEAIGQRLNAGPSSSYIRDWVFGGIDGAVTTFAVVSGSAGADLSTRTIIVLGVANLVADGFSMAAGNYLGTRAELEHWHHLEAFERNQIGLEPQGETEEIRQILRNKGFEGDLLDGAVKRITSDRESWIRMMLTEEYGLPLIVRSPWIAAFSTFSAFIVCGFVPLAPFVLGSPPHSTWIATALTATVFFGIGSLKSHWSLTAWWRSGLLTLTVGLLAAASAYGIGLLLGRIQVG